MNNDKDNKTLRDELSSLDTLSGGIVYGKEEAWEKLQARLDAKPAKSITLKYALAAAIILLLSFTSLFIYFSHNTQTEQNNTAKISSSIPTSVAQPTNQKPVTQPETAPIYTSVNTVERRKKINIAHPVSQPLPVQVAPAEPSKENVLENKTALQPSPAPPVQKPMRIVHLNELNREPEQTDNGIVYGQSVDVSTLPKVHINDMIHEENEIQKILQENRLGVGRQFLLWHERGGMQDNSSNDNTPGYPSNNKPRFRIN